MHTKWYKKLTARLKKASERLLRIYAENLC
jgi:hypothetical protein